MFAFLILPILVAGFVYCHNHPYHFYRLHRHDGQYLYINSAKFGTFSFAVASVLAACLHYVVPDKLIIPYIALSFDLGFISTEAERLLGKDDAALASWLFSTSLLSVLIAYLTSRAKWKILCYKLGSNNNAKLYIISDLLEDSPLDRLLFKLSLDKNALAMLSLSDRKVYVGKVISLGEPNESEGPDQEITISPVVSGYRDKDNLQVTFTTYYQDAGSDLAHVIRQDMITHASEFSFEIFENFKKENPDSTPESKSAIEIAAILEQESASKLK